MYQPDGTWKIKPHTKPLIMQDEKSEVEGDERNYIKEREIRERNYKKRGRKPLDDKKQLIRFFIEESIIRALGEDRCKDLCLEHLRNERRKLQDEK